MFPAVVGLLGDVDVPRGLGDGLALGGEGFDLAELGDDLLRGVFFFFIVLRGLGRSTNI